MKDYFFELINLGNKKSVFEAFLLYSLFMVLFLALIASISLEIGSFSSDNGFELGAWLAASLVGVVSLYIVIVKGLLRKRHLLIGLCYIIFPTILTFSFGLIFGSWPLIFVFTNENSFNNSEYEKILLSFSIQFFIGFIVALSGGVVTLLSYFFAGESSTFTVFYGLTIWGFYIILRNVVNAFKLSWLAKNYIK